MSVGGVLSENKKVSLKVTDKVAWVEIDNERNRNAMTLQMWRQLRECIQQAEDHADVNVIAITGAGDKAFISGADISEFATLRDSEEQVKEYGQAVEAAQNAIAHSSKPTVALINGLCIGGGIGVALACDLRYSSMETKFRMPAARLGLGYDLHGLARAVDVMGYANTADIFLSARVFDGTEAQRLGLVNLSFAAEHFDKEARSMIQEIAHHAPLSLRSVKLSLRYLLQRSQGAFADQQALTNEQVEKAVQQCFDSQDYREGQLAFKEKRTPNFVGR